MGQDLKEKNGQPCYHHSVQWVEVKGLIRERGSERLASKFLQLDCFEYCWYCFGINTISKIQIEFYPSYPILLSLLSQSSLAYWIFFYSLL